MNEVLAKLRKTVQKQLSNPNCLFWKFDGQERDGHAYHVFLDLTYLGKIVVVEWHRLWGDEHFGISLFSEDAPSGDHDFTEIGLENAVQRVLTLLEPSAT